MATEAGGCVCGWRRCRTSRVWETLSSLDVAGRFRPVVPAGGSSSVGTANPVGSDSPVVEGSPIGLCETLSPLFHDALGPLEHSVPDETILGLDLLEHSGLDHAETILGLDPLEHSGLEHAVPVGRHVAGGYARVASFYSGVVNSQSTMTPGGPRSHGVVPERTGGDVIGS